MSPVFDFLFGQYSGYATIDIVLEITGVLFGLMSVWYAKKNNIWVYPTGMISTSIFVYLLFKSALLGDMIINAYYFIMSAYGWYYWSKREEQVIVHPITSTTKKEFKTALLLFVASLLFVFWIYQVFDKWKDWTAYVDTLTTAIFFVGMGLMARRKIEHWLFWILGDIISIPLYFYKGLTLTSLQYVIFTHYCHLWIPLMEKDLRQNPSHILRVVLYGPESTGKTTLAKALAKHYQTEWVQEFARDYLQNKWEEQQAVCTLEDLPIIVAGQLELENQKLVKANRLLFCDTNVLVTRVWSETHFDGYCHPEILGYSEKWSYDLYLLTGIDVPWVKDDLRDRPDDRQSMFDHFKSTLDKLQKNYVVLEGNQDLRLNKAIASIDPLLKKV